MDELHHECGIAAIYHLPSLNPSRLAPLTGPEQVSRLMPRMLLDLQNRGQLAAGFTTYDPRREKLLDTYKQVGTVIEAFRMNHKSRITLTSGILADQPILYGINATTVNAAVEGFARASAIELPRGLRINVVSPSVLQESLDDYGPYFRGIEAVPASRVALAYSRSVEGRQTGQVYRVL